MWHWHSKTISILNHGKVKRRSSSTDMLPTNFAVLGMIQQVKNSKAKIGQSTHKKAFIGYHPFEKNSETNVLAMTTLIEKKTKSQNRNRK
uniref:Ovule protein n=1 Tax=Caenorhabditis tropicalis TaxID=1561998 RepID=A0A1I7UBR0_9PELO